MAFKIAPVTGAKVLSRSVNGSNPFAAHPNSTTGVDKVTFSSNHSPHTEWSQVKTQLNHLFALQSSFYQSSLGTSDKVELSEMIDGYFRDSMKGVEAVEAQLEKTELNTKQNKFSKAVIHTLRGSLTSFSFMSYHLKRAGMPNVQASLSPAKIQKQQDAIDLVPIKLSDLNEAMGFYKDCLPALDRAGKEICPHPATVFDVEHHREALTIAEKKQQFFVEGKEHLNHPIAMDPLAVSEALRSVISNAVKYTPDKGTISVFIKPVVHNDSNGVLFTITDDGIGIPESLIKTIGKKEGRGDNVESRYGTGKGASVAQSLIEAEGGTIQYISPVPNASVDKPGTQVQIFFPYVKPTLIDSAMNAVHQLGHRAHEIFQIFSEQGISEPNTSSASKPVA